MIKIMLIAALLPVMVLLFMVYQADRVEHEPAGLLFRLLLWGAFMGFPASLLETLLGNVIYNACASAGTSQLVYQMLENVIGIALVEEGLKYAVVRWRTWRNPAFNFRFDGIVYCVFASLGFAALENVLYGFSFGFTTLAVRAITSIPGHAVFGVMMGYYYGRAKKYHDYGNMAGAREFGRKALIIPVLFHGFYDLALSLNSAAMAGLWLIAIIAADVWAIRTVRREAFTDEPV